MPREPRIIAACISVLAATASSESIASAQPPDPGLLARLAKQSEGFGALYKRATFKMNEVLDELDGDGKVASHKVTASHVVVQGDAHHEIVDRCTKDGADCTAKEQEEVQEHESKKDDSEKLDKRTEEATPKDTSGSPEYKFKRTFLNNEVLQIMEDFVTAKK